MYRFCVTGSAGSCMPLFTTAPYLQCRMNHSCEFGRYEDFSYWLSAVDTLNEAPIADHQLSRYISRCVLYTID
jgi:collagen type IV alpha